jgi:hypothetical protein
MTLEFSRQIFEKNSNIKYYENPYSWNQVVPWGQTDGKRDGNDEAFRNFANAPKIPSIHEHTKISLGQCKTTWIWWYKLRRTGKATRFFRSVGQGRRCVHLEQFSIPLFLSPIVSKVKRTLHVVLKLSICKPEFFQHTWTFQSKQRTVIEADMTVNRQECIIGANFSYVRRYHVKEEVIYFFKCNEMGLHIQTRKVECGNRGQRELIYFCIHISKDFRSCWMGILQNLVFHLLLLKIISRLFLFVVIHLFNLMQELRSTRNSFFPHWRGIKEVKILSNEN